MGRDRYRHGGALSVVRYISRLVDAKIVKLIAKTSMDFTKSSSLFQRRDA